MKMKSPSIDQIKFTDEYVESLVPGEYSTEAHADWMARALRAYSGFAWLVERDLEKGGVWLRALEREPDQIMTSKEGQVLSTLFDAVNLDKVRRYYMWVDELEGAISALQGKLKEGGKWVEPVEAPEAPEKAAS